MNENKEYEKDKRKPWEIFNEQKEKVLNIIKEFPKILDTQVLIPELVYPNGEKYKVNNALNNVILSTVAMDKKYADNTWILAETVSNAKHKDSEGKEKQSFFLKKGEKATKIGIEVKEKNVQDPITGTYYKEKLEKPYIKNVNVYNLSQFAFAKDTYPQKTYVENKKKDTIILSEDKIEELNRNTFEAKLEKFFIEQQYNIKDKEKISEINPEELKNNIENTRQRDGELHKDAYRIELFSGIGMANAKRTIENSKIEKNLEKENKQKVKKNNKEKER